MSFVSDVESDQQGRDRFDRARIGEWAAVNVATTLNRGDERAEALFGLLVVAANNDVAFHFAVETDERLGPDVLEGRDDLNAFGRKLTALLRRRPRPYAQDASRFASYGRLERNCDVNDQRAGLDLLANFFERGDVRGEGNSQHNDRGSARGVGVR